jgi:putative addiction module component (TIGR02574 family)
MATLTEVEKLAFELSERQRGILASKLLGSLPSYADEEEDEIAEATRRMNELEANPEMGIPFEELMKMLKDR